MRTRLLMLALMLTVTPCASAQKSESSSEAAPELQKAWTLFNSGNDAAATALVEAYSRQHKSDPAARFTAGLLLARAGEFDRAAAEFRATAGLRPNYEAYYNLGLCDSHLHNWQDARSDYFQAINQKQDAYEPNVRLALDYLAQKKDYLAIPWLLKAQSMKPGDQTVMYLLGDAWTHEGYLESAVSILTELAKLRPTDARSHAMLGDAYAKMQRFAEAQSEYNRAIELAPRVAELHYELGQIETKLSLSAEAEASFRKSLDLDPNLPRAWAALGEAVMNAGRWDEALPYLQRSLKLNPDDADARFDLSKVFIQKKNYVAAESILKKLTMDDPTDSRFAYELSRVYQGRGQKELAAAELQRFQQLNKDSLGVERVQHPLKYIH
jgi:tetratricopeptide (TPR) repeat protein